MRKNNKGFVITEVLIISTVVIGILIFMYAQFKNINRNYQYSFRYDTVQGMYLANNIVNYINDESYDLLVEQLNSSGLGYLDITGCSVFYFNTSNYCQMLFDKSEVEQVLFTKENMIDLKSSMFDLSEDMKEYINNISPTNSENDYRIIIKYKNNTFATMKFNKGQTYVKNGLIVHLDAINNTGNGHSNEITTWNDLSGNNNHAILYNNPTWNNNSITFDGLTNYARIETTKNLSFGNGLTVEARIKVLSSKGTNISGNIDFLGNLEGNGFSISYSGANSFYSETYINDNTYKTTSNITQTSNDYHTITLTYDNKTLKIYEDGKLVGNNSIEGLMSVSEIPISLGGNPNSDMNYMDSYANIEFENILIYNRALTEYEVIKNYQIDKSRF